MKSLAKMVMVLALVAVIFLPGMASADTSVSLAYQGVSSDATTYIIETLSPPYTGGVHTGNYTISYSTAPSTIINGYCVDVQESASIGTYAPYTLKPIAQNSAFAAVAWILNQHYTGTQTQEGQVAAWELAWDYANNNSFSLTTGNFQLTNPSPDSAFGSAVESIYDDALAALPTFNPSGYVLAYSPQYQDFVVPNPNANPNPVPAPGTFILLGSGLMGIVIWRRRRASLKG